MGFFNFGDARDARNEVYNTDTYTPEHKAKFSHEMIGGAAAFEAMHIWEKEQRKEGKTVDHAFAKEALAGLAAAETDKLFETKGLDFVDREQARRHASRQAEQLYDQQYGGQDNYSTDYEIHDSMRY
ncbi:hypothetical protein B0T17DRAFT_496994 [Bombardia bombarda]|uniref:CipC-like antibiotic response protein n=1 Tax=Bombardia bombarda TaxID=252184 RepID=A0AA40BWB3_9PEZI|nr:hypothetical protein B0T17DRAFT_496994 [Bombardia bombarda]